MGTDSSTRSMNTGSPKEEKEGKNPAEEAVKEKDEINYKIIHNELSPELKDIVLKIYEKNKREKSTLPKLIEGIKKDLEKKYGQGWAIFAGQQFTGICSHFKGRTIEFEVDGIIHVIFLPWSKPVAMEGL